MILMIAIDFEWAKKKTQTEFYSLSLCILNFGSCHDHIFIWEIDDEWRRSRSRRESICGKIKEKQFDFYFFALWHFEMKTLSFISVFRKRTIFLALNLYILI